MYLQYSKGDYNKMREKTVNFTHEKYPNGNQNT